MLRFILSPVIASLATSFCLFPLLFLYWACFSLILPACIAFVSLSFHCLFLIPPAPLFYRVSCKCFILVTIHPFLSWMFYRPSASPFLNLPLSPSVCFFCFFICFEPSYVLSLAFLFLLLFHFTSSLFPSISNYSRKSRKKCFLNFVSTFSCGYFFEALFILQNFCPHLYLLRSTYSPILYILQNSVLFFSPQTPNLSSESHRYQSSLILIL